MQTSEHSLRPGRRRTTRHAFIALLVAMLAGSVLAACGGDDDDDGGSASEGGGDARPLVVGQVAEPASLDPGAVTAVNDFRINVNLYDGLVQYAEGSLDVEPALATEWTVDDSGTVYTFTLRDDVTFHDGTEFDAEAVKFNFDRMLDENHPQYETGPFPLAEQFFGQIDEVVVNDTYEVEFQLAEPWAPFLSNLAYPTGLLVSPTAVEESGQDFGRNPVGTGPFMFVEWESNQGVTLEANPDYWGGAPAADGVVFRPLVESASRVAELRSGGVDMIVEVPPDDLVALRDDENFQIAEQAGPHVWFLILNAAEPPFDDVRMRQAANYAINREAIVDNVLSGWASVAKGPIAEAFGEAYDPDLAGYDYDPDEAMALIEEAGYGDGVDVTFYVTEGGSGMLEPGTMAEAIQADLAEVGIDASIETYEWNTFLDQVNPGLEGKAAMAEMAWMTNDPGTLPYLTLRTGAFPDEGGFNSGYYSNPEVDELIEQAQVATDPDERADLYHQMQQLVVEDAPWVFVASWKQNAAMTNEVSGFELHPSFLLELDGTSVGG